MGWCGVVSKALFLQVLFVRLEDIDLASDLSANGTPWKSRGVRPDRPLLFCAARPCSWNKKEEPDNHFMCNVYAVAKRNHES